MTSQPDNPAGHLDRPTTTGTAGLRIEDHAFLRVLGKRIRLARVDREYSQEQLARRAGMSRNFVSSIERGAHGIDVRRLRWLARALGLPVDQLLPTDEEVRAAAAALPPRPARRDTAAEGGPTGATRPVRLPTSPSHHSEEPGPQPRADVPIPLPQRHPGRTDPAQFTRAALTPPAPLQAASPAPDPGTPRTAETAPAAPWRDRRRLVAWPGRAGT
jgi:transcriptional regulator with XRE-family HTH domain